VTVKVIVPVVVVGFGHMISPSESTVIPDGEPESV
jgi:hypothetical protein